MSTQILDPGQALEDDDVDYGKRKRTETRSSSVDSNVVQNNEHVKGHGEPRQDVRTPKKPRLRVASAEPKQTSTLQDTLGMKGSLLLQLPVEILQNILSFTDPFSLAKLMSTSRFMYDLLMSHVDSERSSRSYTTLPILSSDQIWFSSRRLYLPGVPQPLQSTSELDMLRLIFGRTCQICGNLPKKSVSKLKETPWNSGPGPEGVRTIWPFKSRLCASCLRPRLLKESDVASQANLEILEGLPSVSFTPSLNYVMSISLHQEQRPSGLHLTGFYFRHQVEELEKCANRARMMGDEAYASWFHSLRAQKQELTLETTRLEAWELSQRVSSGLTVPSQSVAGRSSVSDSSIHSDMYTRSHVTASSGPQRQYTALSDYSQVGPSSNNSLAAYPDWRSDLLRAPSEPRPGQFIMPRTLSSAPRSNASQPARAPADRAAPDVSRLRAEKRIDIQSRCRNLDPPITPGTLDGLPAFQAALKILMPLNESSWQVLRTRLLAQVQLLDHFDSLDHENASDSLSMGTSAVLRIATPPAELVEHDPREQAIRPVRERLSEFANEFVRRQYSAGTNLTYNSAPQFAADVLLHVRRRFFECQAREDAAFIAHRQPLPDEGPGSTRPRRLRLEHMKHVFDTTVKPLTEFIRKELFLCSACDTQGKHFAFESIIQHFAYKHTNSFSRGNAVVSWKADWPDDPPFHPTPSADTDWLADPSHQMTRPQSAIFTRSSNSGRMASSTTTGESQKFAHVDIPVHYQPGLVYNVIPEHYGSRYIEPRTHDTSYLEPQRPNPAEIRQQYGRDSLSLLHPDHQSYSRHPTAQPDRQDQIVYDLVRDSYMHDGVESGVSSTSRPVLVRSHSAYERRGHPEVIADSHRYTEHAPYPYNEVQPSYRSTVPHALSDAGPLRVAQAGAYMDITDGQSTLERGSDRRGIQSMRSNTNEADIHLSRNAAERFLDTLDPIEAAQKQSLLVEPTIESRRLYESEDRYLRSRPMDRRSNISQRRKRSMDRSGDYSFDVQPNGAAVPVTVLETRHIRPRSQNAHFAVQNDFSHAFQDVPSLDGDWVPSRSQDSINTVQHTAQSMLPISSLRNEQASYYSTSRYVDGYGREYERVDPEVRYEEPNRPVGSSYERLQYHPEERHVLERQYRHQPYEREPLTQVRNVTREDYYMHPTTESHRGRHVGQTAPPSDRAYRRTMS